MMDRYVERSASGRATASTIRPSRRNSALSSSPSPVVEVRVGSVRGVVPKGWVARLLPVGGLSPEGFEASPQITEWQAGDRSVPGMEAFWVDIDKLGIPSDYYYLAARSVSFGEIGTSSMATDILPAWIRLSSV